MTTYGLVHGAWHGAWCWSALAAELVARGHRAVAMDLPAGDPEAGPEEYARAVVAALDGVEGPVVLVGHSLGGLTIGSVTALRPVDHTVYLCALVPAAGKSWGETRLREPAMDAGFGSEHFDAVAHGGTLANAKGAAEFLYNECPAEAAAAAVARLRPQTYGITSRPQLDFPVTPSTYISARNDRLVLRGWSRASVAKDLAHARWIEIEGDHSPMLGRPAELAGLLDGLA